ncbi:hypothetical protein Vretifemale_17026 [Volvox reticuliferus]|nr:hypothetical protein Vretifemale_17026 [Volvox reticuliferus]
MPDILLVNRAPFLGENEDAWLLLPPAPPPGSSPPLPPASSRASSPPLLMASPLLQMAQQTRAAEFARLVSYQLYLKNALITQLSVQQGLAGNQRGMADTTPPSTSIDWDATAYGNVTVLSGVSQAAPPMGDVTPAAVAALLSMDPEDVMRVAKVISSAVQHRNAAMDIQLPYSSQYRSVLDKLAEAAVAVCSNLSTGASNGNSSSSSTSDSSITGVPPSQDTRRETAEVAAAVSGTSTTAEETLLALQTWAVQEFVNITQQFPYPGVLIRIYVHTIGAIRPRRSPPALPAQPPPGAHRRPLSPGMIAVIVVVVVMAVCLSASLIWHFLRIRNKVLLQESGRMPGADPNTTLVVTDVQGSTTLWEVLSGDLMDEVLHIHHRVVRQAISQWKGYEVFTEGDAFAVVFHLPEDALDFAVGLQAALLGADWPPELLEQPDCCEVWACRHSAQPPSPNSKRSMPADMMVTSGPPGGCSGMSGVGTGPAPPSGPLAVSTPGGTQTSTATGERDESMGGRPGRRILNVLSPFRRKSFQSSSNMELGLRPGWGAMGRFPKLLTSPGGGPTIPSAPSFLNRGAGSASVPVLSPGGIGGGTGAQYGTSVGGAISTGTHRWISTPSNNVSPLAPVVLTRTQMAGTAKVSGANSRLHFSQGTTLKAARSSVAPCDVAAAGATMVTRLTTTPYMLMPTADGTTSSGVKVGDDGTTLSTAATAAAVAAATDAVIGSGGGSARAPDRTSRNRTSRVVPYLGGTVSGGSGGHCYRSMDGRNAVTETATSPHVAAMAYPGAIATNVMTIAIAASPLGVTSTKEDRAAVAGPLPRLSAGHLPSTELQVQGGRAAYTGPPSQELSRSYGAASHTELAAEAGAGAAAPATMACTDYPGEEMPREEMQVSELPGPCVNSSERHNPIGLLCDVVVGEAECRISTPVPTQGPPAPDAPWLHQESPSGIQPRGLPPWQLPMQQLQETQKKQPQLRSSKGSNAECVRSQELINESDDGCLSTEAGGDGHGDAIINTTDMGMSMGQQAQQTRSPGFVAAYSFDPEESFTHENRKAAPPPIGGAAAIAAATAAVPPLAAARIDGLSEQQLVPPRGAAFGVRRVGAQGSDIRRFPYGLRDLGRGGDGGCTDGETSGPPATAAVMLPTALDEGGSGYVADWRSCVAWDTSTSYNTFEGPDRETHCSGSTPSVARSSPPPPVQAPAPLSSPFTTRATAAVSTVAATFHRPPPLKLLSSTRCSSYKVIANNSQQPQQEHHPLPDRTYHPGSCIYSPGRTGSQLPPERSYQPTRSYSPLSYLLGSDRSYVTGKARSPNDGRQSLSQIPSGSPSQAPAHDGRRLSRPGSPFVVMQRAGSAIGVDGWFSRRRRLLLQPTESTLRRAISAHRSLAAAVQLDADAAAVRLDADAAAVNRAAGDGTDGNLPIGIAVASDGTTSIQTAGGAIFGSGSQRPSPQAVMTQQQQQQEAGGRSLLKRLNASFHRGMPTLPRISAGSATLWATVSGLAASPTAVASSTAVTTNDINVPLSPSQPPDCTATAAALNDHTAEDAPVELLGEPDGLELRTGHGGAAGTATVARAAAGADAADNNDVPSSPDAATMPNHITVTVLTASAGADNGTPCAVYDAAPTSDMPPADISANGTEAAAEATASIVAHGGAMATPTAGSGALFRFMDPAAMALGLSTSRVANANSSTAPAANGLSTSLALIGDHMLYHMGRSSRLLMLGQAAAAASSAPPVATSLAAGASRGSIFMDLLWRDINTAASVALGSANTVAIANANGGVIIGHASAAAAPGPIGADITDFASAPLQRCRPEGWSIRTAAAVVTGGAVGAAAGLAYTVASALQSIYEQVNTEGVLAHLGMFGTLGGVLACGGSGVANVAGMTGSLSMFMAEPQLVLRGLRLRVGLHSGPSDAEVVSLVQDGVAGARYFGRFLSTSKDVCDAATGGMVLASGATFRAYQQRLREAREARGQRGGGGGKFDLMLIHLGEYLLGPTLAAGSAEDIELCAVKGGRPRRPVFGVNMPAAGHTAASAGAEDASVELYGVVCPWLVPRLAVLPSPVRGIRQVVPGCLSAPAGVVTPVFCNVLGVEALLAWERVVQQRQLTAAVAAAAAATVVAATTHRASPESSSHNPLVRPAGTSVGDAGCGAVVQEALELFRKAAMAAAACHGGYVVAVSADGGHWVLVFGAASSAVRWGLDMLDAMLGMPWPDGLLDHELTEEVYEGGALVKRGLRLRIGADRGCAMLRPVPRTGRLDYVGRPMNRAARIAAKAKAATMFVTGAVWDMARDFLERPVSASCLGLSQLKGVREQVELWALRSVSARAAPAAAIATAAGDSAETAAAAAAGADAAAVGRVGAC